MIFSSVSPTALLLLALALCLSSSAATVFYSWTNASAPNLAWTSVAISGTGIKAYAVSTLEDTETPSGIFASINYGQTFRNTTAASQYQFYQVATSYNGRHVVAVALEGGVFTSSTSGKTWNHSYVLPVVSQASWTSVACDIATGMHISVVGFDTGIYTSSDFGRTWTNATANGGTLLYHFNSIASNFNGTVMVAAAMSEGGVFKSTDKGLSWSRIAGLNSSVGWSAVSIDYSGDNIVVAQANTGLAYYSTDSGVTWSSSLITAYAMIVSMSSNDDGSIVLAAAQVGGFSGQGIYASYDYGKTWSPVQITANDASLQWSAVAVGGGIALAAADEGGIYVSTIYDIAPIDVSFDDDMTLSDGAIAGIAIGCVAFAMIATYGVIHFRKRQQFAQGDGASNSGVQTIESSNPMYRGDKKNAVYKYDV